MGYAEPFIVPASGNTCLMHYVDNLCQGNRFSHVAWNVTRTMPRPLFLEPVQELLKRKNAADSEKNTRAGSFFPVLPKKKQPRAYYKKVHNEDRRLQVVSATWGVEGGGGCSRI